MPSAPRCGRWRSPASSRGRWRSTSPSRSRAPTCPTSTGSTCRPRDRERFADYEDALATELAGYLLEHARRERLALLSRPVIEFETDERLGLGEFGIQTRVVQPGGRATRPRPTPRRRGEEASGRTMVYSTAGRVAEPLEERARARQQTALLVIGGRRLVVGPAARRSGAAGSATWSLDDPNVSRQHAEVRPRGGSWVVTDLGSTNGSRLNGRRLDGPEVLKPGDEIELGTTAADASSWSRCSRCSRPSPSA